MARVDLSDAGCSVARTLDAVGDTWTLLVLRDALYGLRRFDEFRTDLGIARNVLADRLARLVDDGILEKWLYEEHPPRYEYRLTDKGRDLLPVILAMMRWGDRWAFEPGDTPSELVHRTCGASTHAEVTCASCGEPLVARALVVSPLPEGVVAALERRPPVARVPDPAVS